MCSNNNKQNNSNSIRPSLTCSLLSLCLFVPTHDLPSWWLLYYARQIQRMKNNIHFLLCHLKLPCTPLKDKLSFFASRNQMTFAYKEKHVTYLSFSTYEYNPFIVSDLYQKIKKSATHYIESILAADLKVDKCFKSILLIKTILNQLPIPPYIFLISTF